MTGLRVFLSVYWLLGIIGMCVVLASVPARHAMLGCQKIDVGFHDSWGNLEDYVHSFPAKKQAKVRRCLDALWTEQVR